MSTYLWINIGVILIPILASFHPSVLHFRNWKAILLAILVPAGIYIAWDVIFTHWGVWGFNQSHVTELTFFGLPLDEVLFFFTIPYACIFTYEWVRRKLNLDHFNSQARKAILLAAVGLLILGVANLTKMYTSVTAFITSSILFLIYFRGESLYAPYLVANYVIIYTFPFLIVNGLLTGSWISEAVVWYNDNQNLGIRFMTIPVEDFIYGLGLMSLNTAIYERFRLK